MMKVECNEELLVRLIGEFSATAMLMCLLPIACISVLKFPDNLLQISIGCGIVIGACVQCFARVSGAHINPCLSVAACIVGKMSVTDMAFYIIMQYLGALTGYGIYILVMPWEIVEAHPCWTIPHSSISYFNCFGIEFVLTSTLVLFFLGCIDPRNATQTETFPLKFAHIICGIVLYGGYFTGASVNPARSFPPALVFSQYKAMWVYYLSHILSATSMACAWRFIYGRTADGNKQGNKQETIE